MIDFAMITRHLVGDSARMELLSTTFLIHGFVLLLVVFAVSLCRRFTAVYILLVLPGTVMHELCHWLVGVLTLARPGFPSIIPHRTSSGWMLGSVGLRNARWFNGLLVAFAPLLLLPGSAWLYFNVVLAIPMGNPMHWAVLYLAIVSAMSAMPSPVDFKLAWKCSAPVLVIALVAAVGYFAWTTGLIN